jgi:hypothetical protein
MRQNTMHREKEPWTSLYYNWNDFYKFVRGGRTPYGVKQSIDSEISTKLT